MICCLPINEATHDLLCSLKPSRVEAISEFCSLVIGVAILFHFKSSWNLCSGTISRITHGNSSNILEQNQTVGVALKNQKLSIGTWNFIVTTFKRFQFSMYGQTSWNKQPWHHPSFVYSVFAIDTVIHCAV